MQICPSFNYSTGNYFRHIQNVQIDDKAHLMCSITFHLIDNFELIFLISCRLRTDPSKSTKSRVNITIINHYNNFCVPIRNRNIFIADPEVTTCRQGARLGCDGNSRQSD